MAAAHRPDDVGTALPAAGAGLLRLQDSLTQGDVAGLNSAAAAAAAALAAAGSHAQSFSRGVGDRHAVCSSATAYFHPCVAPLA